MDLSVKRCERLKSLVTTYHRLKDECCCCENELEVIKNIQNSLEPLDFSEENQLHLCLLSLSTISLIGKLLWQLNHEEICIKLEQLSKNVVSANIIYKLVHILLKCQNKHITYSVRKSLTALLFNYPKEVSMQVESHVLSFLSQAVPEEKINCSILEMLHDIISFQRPLAQSSGSTVKLTSSCKSYHEYDMDDRIDEIKMHYVNAGIHMWNDLSMCLQDKNCNYEQQFITLDAWSYLVVTGLQFQLPVKDILAEKSRSELLKVSYQPSSSICAKVCMTLNQILFINYLQATEILPMEIIHLSEDIITVVKNDWLDKISLKTSCNTFIGEHAITNSGTEKVCHIQLRNIVLIILKSLNIVVKNNEQVTAEDNFLVLHPLVKWLSNIWNMNEDKCTDQKCLIELFFDQDDQLLEMMTCSLNLYTYLQPIHRIGILSEAEVMETFNPHMMFLCFIQGLDYDYSLLLDLLTSNETCALHYLLQYLKLVKLEWHSFIQVHQMMSEEKQIDLQNTLLDTSGERTKKDLHSSYSFDKLNKIAATIDVSSKSFDAVQNNLAASVHLTIEMLIQLSSTIQRLLDKGLFPYNAYPLIRILNDCIKLYNCNEIA